MPHPSPSAQDHAAASAKIAALFDRAASEGRHALSEPELVSLLAELGLMLAAAAPAAASAPVALRIGLDHTREFGPVISAGLGGLDGELADDSGGKDRVRVHAAVELTDAGDFLALFRRTLAYRKLAAIAGRDGHPPPDGELEATFARILTLAGRFAPGDRAPPFVLRSLTLDAEQGPDRLTVRRASCEFGAPAARPLPRPIHKIDKLVHPASIGLVGVSATGMNFGRIILRNLMGSGYAKERLTVIRAGETEIDGVRCVASLQALPGKLDLLDRRGRGRRRLRSRRRHHRHRRGGGGDADPGRPRRNGEEPGAGGSAGGADQRRPRHGGRRSDLPRRQLPGRGLAPGLLRFVVHSAGAAAEAAEEAGAQLGHAEPERRVHDHAPLARTRGSIRATCWRVGNQTDLTHGDMLAYFAERPEIETVGVYIEGFRDGDGLDFVRAVRRAVQGGKQVVVYKAGRTAPGTGGVMGHTASIAGSAAVFDSVVRHAGAIVAEDFGAFDDLFYIAGALHRKTIGGNRLGAISGAGFEAVGMADSIEAESFALAMGALEAGTVARVQAILAAKRLDALVEVRNPIDINPGADDEAHLQITEAFLQDPNIDAVVVGLDPTAPAIRALEASKLRPGFDISDPKSTVHLMPPLVERNDKPVIGIVDGGRLYDAMAARPDGPRRLRVPQLRARHAGAGALRRGAAVRGRAATARLNPGGPRVRGRAAEPNRPITRHPPDRGSIMSEPLQPGTHPHQPHRRRPRPHHQLHGRGMPRLLDAEAALRRRDRLPRPAARAPRARQGLGRHAGRARPRRRHAAGDVGGDHRDADRGERQRGHVRVLGARRDRGDRARPAQPLHRRHREDGAAAQGEARPGHGGRAPRP